MIKSENLRIDEFIDKNDMDRNKEPEDYNRFVYVYADIPYTLPKLQQRAIKEQLALPK